MSEHLNNHPIAVLGAGSWGTALAILTARNHQITRLWGHRPDFMETLHAARENFHFLPDIAFPESLSIYNDLKSTLDSVANVIIAVPSHAFRNLLTTIAPLISADTRIISATKGIETDSRKLTCQIAAEILGQDHPIAILSGPTFAQEVAAGLPAAVTIASNQPDVAEQVSNLFHNQYFRTYTSNDPIGVQIGGAVKNTLAIAAGIADGLGFGANTRAALITRGMAEMMRLGLALGGKKETFMGLAGLGDLVLTCTDNLSRNRRFGLLLSQGLTVQQALEKIGQVVEGVQSAHEIFLLARSVNIDMPITEQTYRVLYENHGPRLAVDELLAREPKAEICS